MKLKNLLIKNFISIKQASLDFTKFRDGVFLISGPTGSGKSTMLDAIHWALYGVTLNQNRAANSTISKSIYSDYAGEKDELKVELTFEQSGYNYKIIRTMSKSGTTTLKFHTPDMIFDKIREGNTAIEKVVGLNSKQFDQMVMLEQGNFSKFLLADSKDRAVLLRNVFDTQLFRDLEQRLKEKEDSLKNEIDGLIALEQTYLRGNTLDTIRSRIELAVTAKSDNEKQLEQFKADLKNYQELLPKLHDYNQAMSLYTTAQRQREQLEQQRTHIDTIAEHKALYEQYDVSIKLYDKAVAVKQSLDNAEAEIKKLQQELWNVACKEVSADDVEKLKAKADELQRQFNGAYDYEETERKLGYLAIDYKKTEEQIADTEQRQAEIKQTGDTLNDQLPVREQYERELVEYEKNSKLLKAQLERRKRLKTQLDSAKPDYVESLKSHLLQICEKGTCPICGTAFVTDTNAEAPKVSFDDFQKLQNELYSVEQWITNNADITEPVCDVEISASDIRAKLNELSKQLNACTTELNKLTTNEAVMDRDADQLKARLIDLREFKTMNSKALSIELETAEDAYKDLKVAYDKFKKSESKANEIRTKIASWKQTIEFKKTEAEKDGIPLNPETVKDGLEYRTAVEDYERNQAKYAAETERFNSELERLSAVEAPEKVADITELECQGMINKLNDSITELVRTIAGIDNAVDNDKKLIAEVEEIKAKKAALLPKHKEYKYIHDQISGKNTAKLSLENFVLHRQLEWILETSNRYLATLSNNQFVLNIKWESTGRSQGGLEISILDNLSGKSRPAQTFSGGELFQLSLSLSLGLMSSINSLFGGLDIDMLFCDEGLGTLDHESLNRVLSTLNGLNNISTVGLITHVQEVIDSIPQGFLVDKGLIGTTIKQFGV